MPKTPYECPLRMAPKDWRWTPAPYCGYLHGEQKCQNVKDCPQYIAFSDYLKGKE